MQKIFTVLSTSFLIWVTISWLEICSKNLSDNPIYSAWNFFEILLNLF